MNQDFVTWVGQGRIADRTKEHLAPSDRGILMIRRRFLRDIDAIDARQGPEGDRSATRRSTECIDLPVAERAPWSKA